jgi:hypothetical protein
VCAYKPHKSDPHRGDRIEYPGEVATKTADLTVTKSILNSVCSTKAALYMNMDINNYYLGTPLERYEYVRIPNVICPRCEELVIKCIQYGFAACLVYVVCQTVGAHFFAMLLNQVFCRHSCGFVENFGSGAWVCGASVACYAWDFHDAF